MMETVYQCRSCPTVCLGKEAAISHWLHDHDGDGTKTVAQALEDFMEMGVAGVVHVEQTGDPVAMFGLAAYQSAVDTLLSIQRGELKRRLICSANLNNEAVALGKPGKADPFGITQARRVMRSHLN